MGGLGGWVGWVWEEGGEQLLLVQGNWCSDLQDLFSYSMQLRTSGRSDGCNSPLT